MKKERKPLGDALASEFVYGSLETAVSTPSQDVIEETIQPETTQPKTKKKSSPRKLSIMEKLLPVESKEATKRFTVDLPESMHRKLSILSAKTGRSKAEIVRTLLDDVLQSLNE